MAPFYPVHVRRSDGQVTINKASKAKEENSPLPEQLDTNPNDQGVCDYYRECQPDEGKEVDWRRKLGGMLIREMQPKQFENKNYILGALPHGYRLFEHVRFKTSDLNQPAQKSSKNHAAGSNERQDAYLYGHPQGRKKRYRSPAEFFPHLLWLATDDTGDSNNCTCKFCSPEEIDNEEKQMIPTKDINQSTSGPEADGVASKIHSTLPVFQNNEQKVDSQYNAFLFRTGELIWFLRDNTSWGLGVIMSREPNRNNPDLNRYQIQPLSYPLSNPPSVVCTQNQLRCWLAWSPPPCLNQDFNPHRGNHQAPPTYNSIDWQAYLRNGVGEKNAEIDASILISRLVETTFTLFDRIESKTSTEGNSHVSEVYFNGIFLGSEKIWLGDPLRLRNSANPSDILVLKSIIHRSTPNQPIIIFNGDIYSQGKADDPSSLKPNPNLPPRAVEEMNARNAIAKQAADPSKRVPMEWKLDLTNVEKPLSEIKGRWYESSLLLRLIAPPKDYQAAVQRGELAEASLWMNGQGDCNKSTVAPNAQFRPADTMVNRREDAFGRAVPENFTISSGLGDQAANRTSSNPINHPVKVEGSPLAPPGNQQTSQLPQQVQTQTQFQQQRSVQNSQLPSTHPQLNPNHNRSPHPGMPVGPISIKTEDNSEQREGQLQKQSSAFAGNLANSNDVKYMDFTYTSERT